MRAGPARMTSADAAEGRAVVASVAVALVRNATRVELRARGASSKGMCFNYIWCISMYRSIFPFLYEYVQVYIHIYIL